MSSDLQLKQFTDRRDIDQPLEIVYRSGDRIRVPDLTWLPESMISAAATRLKEYLVRGSPSTGRQWEALGFVVQLETAAGASSPSIYPKCPCADAVSKVIDQYP
ncbi:hypothetical protein TRAPUB_4029 [Trametes pubescens]|uniref:Uncharacterized protein n=1 Tax=Trametes pubescens TaxID=154538 RepID=A0A1M2VCA5_TRAPU|nr:hypothetical protein TRAPUB_4029 [Trametes pubescens]